MLGQFIACKIQLPCSSTDSASFIRRIANASAASSGGPGTHSGGQKSSVVFQFEPFVERFERLVSGDEVIVGRRDRNV